MDSVNSKEFYSTIPVTHLSQLDVFSNKVGPAFPLPEVALLLQSRHPNSQNRVAPHERQHWR